MTMLMNLHPQYITDEDGNKLSVVLPIEEFESIIKDESNDIKLLKVDNDFNALQISSMESTWNNDKDKAWDEL